MWMMPLHLHVNQKSDYDDMKEGLLNENRIQEENAEHEERLRSEKEVREDRIRLETLEQEDGMLREKSGMEE